MARDIADAVDDALRRGAILPETAPAWLERGDAALLDALEGAGVLASAPPPRTFAAAARPAAAQAPGGPGANPLLDEVRQSRPALVAAAERDGPPPELLGDRPLPRFTASGLDPAMLAEMPWPLRRPMAAARSLAEAYKLAELADSDMMLRELAAGQHNAPYVEAFRSWLTGSGRRAEGGEPGGGPGPKESFYAVEDLHRELFGHGPEYPGRA